MNTLRAAVIALALTILVGPLALSGQGAELSCANVRPRGDDFLTIKAPAFTQGAQTLRAFAVNPFARSMLYATNGTQVYKSADSGCSWRLAFELALVPDLDVPISVANSEITEIEVARGPGAIGRVLLGIEESVGPIVRPHVVRSDDGGTTWAVADAGLPPAAGGILGIHGAPSRADTFYAHLVDTPATGGDQIYASTDGGRTWERRSTSSTASYDMEIDPLNANEIWTFGGYLYRSLDGGRSRSQIDGVGPPVPFLDVFHAAGQPARILAYEAETQSFNISRDGGATWSRMMGPNAFALSLAHGATADDVVLSVHDGFYRYKAPTYWLPLEADEDFPDIHDMQTDRSPSPFVYGMTTDTIEVFTALDDTVELPDFVEVDPPTVDTTTSLSPANTTVKLRVGDAKDVGYRFELPGNPTPLDVFFLVDTTKSMDPTIEGLRAGMQRIANELAASRINVQFGVGEIKDYPIPGFGAPYEGDYAYRLLREIGPADDSLGDALEELRASGGGIGDYEEAQLTGLYQAATGEGDPAGLVLPGQDAGFRTEALPVIVNITDYAFHDEAAHPSPPFDRVANELAARGIRQIGLAVFGEQGSEGGPHLREMARRTQAIAPDGVDCDDNGTVDIEAGEALVCDVAEEESAGVLNLAPAIIATVRAIAQEVEVELVTGDDAVIGEIAPAIYPSVDITERNGLDFGVTFTCPPALAGKTTNVALAARVQDIPVASATARVVCRPLAAAAKPKRPPQVLPVPPIVAPVNVAAPLAIAPAAPPVVPQTINAPQSAQAVQGAVAPQEQEQVEVAVAVAQFKNDQALAMSAYTERTPQPAPLYAAAGLMTLAAAGLTVRRRVGVRFARHRRRY